MRVFMGNSANPPETVSDEQSEPKQGMMELARNCDGPHGPHEPDRPDCIRILVLIY